MSKRHTNAGDHTILPERKNLLVGVSLCDFRFIYTPKGSRIYRLAYRVDILNDSKLSVRLFARKWTLMDNHSNLHILEVENVFGTRPILPPRGVFSYGGMQDFSQPPSMLELRIAGVDQMLVPFISLPYTFTRRQLSPNPA